MKILFLIPTKDGGEGFARLVNSIINGVSYAKKQKLKFDFGIYFLINGDPTKPHSYLEKIKAKHQFVHELICPELGKVRAINYGLSKLEADRYFLFDDDIEFDYDRIYIALKELENDRLRLISFQPKTLEYKGKSKLKKFAYDVINIRQLKNLYKGQDTFLFGRFLAFKKNVFKVPSYIMLEDLYLSVVLDGFYKIRPEFIYYEGLDSITKHVKRVIMLESGRRQVRNLMPEKYDAAQKKNKRIIDNEKIKKLSLYYKTCYLLYNILRFYTNRIISKIKKHKTIYW